MAEKIQEHQNKNRWMSIIADLACHSTLNASFKVVCQKKGELRVTYLRHVLLFIGYVRTLFNMGSGYNDRQCVLSISISVDRNFFACCASEFLFSDFWVLILRNMICFYYCCYFGSFSISLILLNQNFFIRFS